MRWTGRTLRRRAGAVAAAGLAGALLTAGITAPGSAVAAARPAAAKASPNSAPGTFRPLTPARILDTRSGLGAPAGALSAGATLPVQVTGRAGVPVAGVAAVVLNLTATQESSSGYLTAFPHSQSRPTASNLNFTAATTTANVAVVPLGTAGQVDVFNGSSGTTQVVADIQGYYLSGSANAAGGFVPLPPGRVLDTRVGLGAPASPAAGRSVVALQVGGAGGVPPSGVASVVLNLTVTGPAAPGYLTAYPDGSARPSVSCLNFLAGQTKAALVTVAVSAAGVVDLYVGAGAGTDLVADVEGYTLSGSGPVAGSFVAVPMARVLDTRVGGFPTPPGAIAGGGTGTAYVQGQYGVPATGVEAVVLNVTATDGTANGYVTASTGHYPRPSTSTLNYQAGQANSNLVVVPVSETGWGVDLYNGSRGTVQLVVDVEGYLLAPTLTWSTTAAALDPPHGYLDRLSCPTPTLCLAVDATGDVTRFDGTSWSDSTRIDGSNPMTAIDCASASRCLAGDQLGFVVPYDGHAWGARVAAQVGALTSISCPTAGFCLLAGSGGKVNVLQGAVLGAPVTIGGGKALAVSCVSSTDCTAVDGGGEALDFDGSSWSDPLDIDAAPLLSLSCPATGFCVAGDAQGRAVVEQAGVWGSPQPVGDGPVAAVSCQSPTSCLAAAGSAVHTFDGGSWTTSPDAQLQAYALSCASGSFCALLGSFGQAATFDGTRWSAYTVVQAPNDLMGLSCGSATFCQATDAEGNAFAFDGTSWSGPVSADVGTTLPARLETISCTADRFCMARDSNGNAVSLSGGTWAPPVHLTDQGSLPSLSCVSASFCAETDNDAFRTYDGQSWADPTYPAGTGVPLGLISCATATSCLATNGLGSWMTFDGTTWSTPRPVGGGRILAGISCPAAGFCAGFTGAGVMMTFDGTGWTAGPTIPALTSVDCVSASFCAAVDNTEQVYLFTGATWLGPTLGPVTLPNRFSGPGPISCGSDALCVANVVPAATTIVGTAG